MAQFEPLTTQEEWWTDEQQAGVVRVEEAGPVIISHVTDFYNRYPGEKVTFYTRLTIRERVSALTLRIFLPEELTPGNYQAPVGQLLVAPEFETTATGTTLIWSLSEDLSPGTVYEYQTEAKVAMTLEDINLASQAVVTTRGQEAIAEEVTSVAIHAKGKYIKHLPGLYEQDELMGRFLMLFESFWTPVDRQIETIFYYLDPRLTPAEFLPWLASWLDVELDERWPEARLRQLLRWAIALHRSRGTKWGLLKYLEIYTGHQAEIVERRARNFGLGGDARLGPGVALGRANQPHTFTVTLRLPAIKAAHEKEQQRQEEIRRRTIISIIEKQKPAHTVYTLNLGILSEESETTPQDLVAAHRTNGRDQRKDEIAAQAATWFKLED
jgi:phage tail-like protein